MALTLTTDDINAIAAAVRTNLATELAAILATKANTDQSLLDTADIQLNVTAGGAGLSNVPWNASWDANVLDIVVAEALTVGQALSGIVTATGTTLPATLADIQAKTAAIGAGTITVSSPTNERGDVRIVAGYDYYAADGRALAWTDDTPTTWPDLTDATATFVVGELEVEASITNPAGPATISVELSRTQTAGLAAGVYPFRVDVTLANTHLILQVCGSLTVSGS